MQGSTPYDLGLEIENLFQMTARALAKTLGTDAATAQRYINAS